MEILLDFCVTFPGLEIRLSTLGYLKYQGFSRQLEPWFIKEKNSC